MPVRLTFHGAAGTVTGSCAELDLGSARVLIDCGMFQGSRSLHALNEQPFPFDPAAIDAVLVTHAHIDHSGLLPKLVKGGFAGKVLATQSTCDLLAYMLPDSGHIQEADAERLNERRQQRGEGYVEPLYTAREAEATLARLRPVPYDRWLPVVPGLKARYWSAGHILGSASIELAAGAGNEHLRILFSGDIGPGSKGFEPTPRGPRAIDYAVCESTYGDRVRQRLTPSDRRALLAAEVRAAHAAGGNLIIPVFAVERTQELLFDLGRLFTEGTLRDMPVFLDSPLAARATEVFARHAGDLAEASGSADPFHAPNVHITESVEASKALDRIRSGAIILSASGMCEGGRVRHHLKSFLWRPNCTVLMVGYQAPGTLGRLLMDGVDRVRINGEDVVVRARIRALDCYSAHADRDQLVEWLADRMPVRHGIFLVHGEPPASEALRGALAGRVPGLPPVVLPRLDDSFVLDPRTALAPAAPPARLDMATAGHDWHNDYAALRLELDRNIRAAANDTEREALLRRLEAALKQVQPAA